MNTAFSPNIEATINGHSRITSVLFYEFEVNRTIYLTGEIDDAMAVSVISDLRYLSSRSDADITLVINSPGGSVGAGLAIYDFIKSGISCDVVTIATGTAASMGAFLLSAGTPGKRYATANTDIMIHQPIGGVQGQATDITRAAEHIHSVKRRLAAILAENCEKTLKKLMVDTERDNWMTAQEAKEYGIIDHVGFPNVTGGDIYE